MTTLSRGTEFDPEMRKLPKHVHDYTDRPGKARHYYKRAGSKPVALPGLPWSPWRPTTQLLAAPG